MQERGATEATQLGLGQPADDTDPERDLRDPLRMTSRERRFGIDHPRERACDAVETGGVDANDALHRLELADELVDISGR